MQDNEEVVSPEEIKHELTRRVEEFSRFLFPNGKREGNHWCVGSIDGEPGESFKICITGEKIGMWGDFDGSKPHCRSLIDLWMKKRGVDFKTALHECADWLGGRIESQSVGHWDGREKAVSTHASFNWRACVDAFQDKHLKWLAKWRGYSAEFCFWLHSQGLVGLFQGRIAFPVIDKGDVMAAHVRRKDGTWRYIPSTKTRPLIIGELAPGRIVYLFESQWDAFAFMDLSGERDGIVCTRGASNGALVTGVLPERANVYLWPQNDTPGEKWANDVCAHVKKSSVVKVAKIPDKFKDVNEWMKAGAAPDDLWVAMNAEKLESVQPFDGIDSFVEGDPADDEPSEEAEPFPLHCLPPQFEAMAKEVCATERVPESLVGCCALGILSASIGAGLVVQSGSNRVTRGNLYLLASAESGSGKSETFRHLARPFQLHELDRIKTWREQERAGALASRSLLEVDIKECKKKYAQERNNDINLEIQKYEQDLEALESRLHPPTLSCEDITSEKLADLLSKNEEQLASLSADAVSIVNILLGRYNKLDRTDESLYLKAFSGDPCVVHRMSRDPISLESPCLTALWLTQPDKLQSLLDERSLNEGGLIPRILACHTNCQPREIGENPPSISNNTEKSYASLISSLLDTYRLAAERFTIEPTAEALRVLNDHHNEIVKKRCGELRDVTSYAARWNEQAWRISVCLHAGTHGNQAHEQPLSLETAQRAITLADWFAVEQLRILNAGRAQRKIERLQRLMQLIIQQYNGKVTLRTLQRNNGFEPAETRELAARFPEKLVIERHETGGRPSEVVRVSKK